MILLGIYWFGRAYNVYSTISHAAREGATVAAQPSCAECSSAFPNDATVVAAVTQVMNASHVPMNIITAYTPNPAPLNCDFAVPPPGCTTTSNITICRNVRLNTRDASFANFPKDQCGVTVSFRYPYQFYFPFTTLNFQLVNIPATASVAMED